MPLPDKECQSLIGKVQQQYLCCLFIIISLFSLIFNHFSQKSRSTSLGIIAAKPLFSSISIFAKNVPEVDRLFPLSDGYFGRFFPVFHEKFSLRTKLLPCKALFLATFRDLWLLKRLTDFFNNTYMVYIFPHSESRF